MKTVVVTGCSSGIGEAICRKFIKDEKYFVYGISRSIPNITSSNFQWIQADITKADDVYGLTEKIKKTTIDLVVNCAGTAFKASGLDFTDNNFHKLFDLNLFAPIYLVSSLKEKLKDGLVINISSTSDRIPEKGYALYCSSKAALNVYFDVVALENPEMKVLHLLPDYVDTPLLRKMESSDFDFTQAVRPDSIADLIYRLSLENSGIASGGKIIVGTNELINQFKKHEEKLLIYNVDTLKLTEVN